MLRRDAKIIRDARTIYWKQYQSTARLKELSSRLEELLSVDSILNTKHEIRNPKFETNSNVQSPKFKTV